MIAQKERIVNMENEKNQKNYYVGLDIGTDSVGYAVTDTDYDLCKFRGEPMWGVTLFDAPEQCADRRSKRCSRRRLDRRQQRVNLIQELFCKEIVKVDPNFFIKLKESALLKCDKSEKALSDAVEGYEWSDKKYHKDYPTVHHLIVELMKSTEKHDIRLIYIACAWLVAHRGHFLSDIDADDIEQLTNIKPLYESFENWFSENGIAMPFTVENINDFADILSSNARISDKEKKLIDLIFNGKKPKNDEDYPISRSSLIKLFAGGSVKIKDLILTDNNFDLEKDSVKFDNSEDLEKTIAQTDEYGELLRRMANIYDCASLSKLLDGKTYISEVKIKEYDTHGNDLKALKYLIKKYAKSSYNDIFRNSGKLGYSSYVLNSKSEVKDSKRENFKRAKRDDFYATVKNVFKTFENVSDEDKKTIDEILSRMELKTYMPKQVNSDNRIIPHQLYYAELKKILENASLSYEFLGEKDEDGISVADKILSVFLFRIPYYVGPLNSKSPYAWLKRKSEGKIYPWNFEQKVDGEESERAFIAKLTNKCTYIPGEDVLPQSSLLYSKFTVLNEINNIKIDGKPISVDLKNELFENLFKRKSKVTLKSIINYFESNGAIGKGEKERVSGLDEEIKSSMKSYIDFSRLLESGKLSEDDVEEIIKYSTCTESRHRFETWLEKNYSLSAEDVKYISGKKYSEFGRLSKELLNGIEGVNRLTGECGTIIHFLVNTNDNLMQILADKDKYTFSEVIENIRREYYAKNPLKLNQRLEEMGVSNAVKRPIIRTLDIMSDIVKVQKCAPKKIFVEMARGGDEESKNKRTVSRKDAVMKKLAEINNDDARRLKDELEAMGESANSRLQSEKLFLYFMQMGKCMYCGKQLDISLIGTNEYNVDHILPRAYVKDDSITNKVLVHSTENGDKSDDIVPESVRKEMCGYWKYLLDIDLINKEKFNRLMRNTPLTPNEKLGFINRQIVETGQSTKAVAELLKNFYPNTEIVYVKAGCVSEFRHEYGNIKEKAFGLHIADDEKRDMQLVKCRSVNDIHHANDAYLNIVVGNLYHEKFTKNFYVETDTYSLKYPVLFGYPLKKDPSVWEPKKHLLTVDKVMANNHVHLTKYQTRQKGGFYDETIYPKSKDLIPINSKLDPAKYGGFNKSTASFFTLVSYKSGKKKELTIVPVDLLVAEKFNNSPDFALEYVKGAIGEKATDISFPLRNRILKVNTVFSLDGFYACISGKGNGGKLVLLRSLTTTFIPHKYLVYAKRLEKVGEKIANKEYRIDEKYDRISACENLEFFDFMADKINGSVFSKMPGAHITLSVAEKEKFESLSLEEQVKCLNNIILYLKTNRAGSCDTNNIGGSSNSGTIRLSSNISNWKYSDIRIVDRSASGLFETRSVNLKNLL